METLTCLLRSHFHCVQKGFLSRKVCTGLQPLNPKLPGPYRSSSIKRVTAASDRCYGSSKRLLEEGDANLVLQVCAGCLVGTNLTMAVRPDTEDKMWQWSSTTGPNPLLVPLCFSPLSSAFPTPSLPKRVNHWQCLNLLGSSVSWHIPSIGGKPFLPVLEVPYSTFTMPEGLCPCWPQ